MAQSFDRSAKVFSLPSAWNVHEFPSEVDIVTHYLDSNDKLHYQHRHLSIYIPTALHKKHKNDQRSVAPVSTYYGR